MATSKKKKAAYTESHARSGSHKKSHQASKSVLDVMSPRVVAVTSVTFLPEAARIMLEEDVGALPVVQEDGKLLGIVTDRDIAVRAVAESKQIESTRVAEVFTDEDLVTVAPDTTLEEAEQLMQEHQVRRLPVVEAGQKLIGIVSLGDIARVTTAKEAGQVIEKISEPGGPHSQQA